MVDIAQFKDRAKWPNARKAIEDSLRGLLALEKAPREGFDLQIKVTDETDHPGYTRRRVEYFVDEWVRVGAWLFVPDGKDERPAIVCCHSAVPQGKDEPAGINGPEYSAFARHYASKGYVTIAPDCLTAGERVAPGRSALDCHQFYKDYPRCTLAGKMYTDYRRSIDVLQELREVDSERVGVIGHDLGALNALLLTALDERASVCVASCGFTMMGEDAAPGRWGGATGLSLIPRLTDCAASGEFPFDWDEVLALIAPSPTLLLTALNDEVLANAGSCETAVARAKKIFKLTGAAAALDNFSHEDGHRMTAATLEEADGWFERWL